MKRLKSKGFTLIELLVAIVIVMSIMALAIVSITKISKQKKKEAKEEVKDQVKTAALSYFSSNEFEFEKVDECASSDANKTNCYGVVTVGFLVNNDYLNVLTDPVTGKKLNECDLVEIKKSGSKYTINAYRESSEGYDCNNINKVSVSTTSIDDSNANNFVHGIYAYELNKTKKTEAKKNDTWYNWHEYAKGNISFDNTKSKPKKDKIELLYCIDDISCTPNKEVSLIQKDEYNFSYSLENAFNAETSKAGKQICYELKYKGIIIRTGECDTAMIDMTKPVLTKEADDGKVSTSDTSNWTNSTITYTVKATDTLSGINETGAGGYLFTLKYNEGKKDLTLTKTGKCGSTSSSSCTIKLITNGYKRTNASMTSEGKRRQQYTVCDNAGNCTTTDFYANIDTEKPTCSTKADPASVNYGQSTKISTTCSDATSGCKEAYLNKKTISNVTANGSSIGSYEQVEDNAGNKGNCNPASYTVIKPDPPTCEVQLTGTKGNNDWYVSNVKMKVVVKSGEVEKIGLGETKTNAKKYDKSELTRVTNGSNITFYGAVKDKYGQEGTCSVTYKLDTKAPICSTSANPSSVPYNGSTQILTSCADETSGCKSTYTSKKTISNVKANGSSIGYYEQVEDKAGNKGNCGPASYTVQNPDAPTCELTASGTKGKNDWYTSDVTITVKKKSGTGTLTYGIGDSLSAAKSSTSQTIKLTQDTTGKKYYGYIKDSFGQGKECTLTVKKDATPPDINYKVGYTPKSASTVTWTSSLKNENYNSSSWKNYSKYNYDFTFTDATSGVNTREWKWNNAGLLSTSLNYKTYTTESNTKPSTNLQPTLGASGVRYATYKVTDKAGNEKIVSTTVWLDIINPTISISTSGNVNQNRYFTLSATDTLSGVKEMQYKIGTGSYKKYSSKVTALSDTGVTTIYAKSIDNAENTSSETSTKLICNKDMVSVGADLGSYYFYLPFSLPNSPSKGISSGYEYIIWNQTSTNDTKAQADNKTYTIDGKSVKYTSGAMAKNKCGNFESKLSSKVKVTSSKSNKIGILKSSDGKHYAMYYCLAVRPVRTNRSSLTEIGNYFRETLVQPATKSENNTGWTIQYKHVYGS